MLTNISFLVSCFLLCSYDIRAAETLLKNTHHSPDNWRRPVKPFKIADHTWYIGTEGLSAILIKNNSEAILIDGGIPGSAKMLINNMKTVGVSPKDLKWVVFTHAHYDHAGPLAEVKRLTGAKIASSTESAALAERGGKDDIHFAGKYPFEAFKTDRYLKDGEAIELGEISLKAHFTPGHTPGSLSWTWTDQRESKSIQIAYVDSLSAPGYKLTNNPRYPDIVKDFRKGIATVRSLPCDLLITPHPEASGWTPINTATPLEKPMTCKAFADKVEMKIDEQIKAEEKNK
jgi:metallo-beta-lactamase class B